MIPRHLDESKVTSSTSNHAQRRNHLTGNVPDSNPWAPATNERLADAVPGGGALTGAGAPRENAGMAQPTDPDRVKLLCGMISADRGLLALATGPLTRAFGPVDLVSDVMNFDFTHYYDEQMGKGLFRRFVSFAQLVNPGVLAEAKGRTNAIEADFAAGAPASRPRPVNIDPGYVAPSKLVLASMKNFSHRIYLGRGVYAEITLMYRNRRWESLDWTFPDYASGRYDGFLTEARSRLAADESTENK